MVPLICYIGIYRCHIGLIIFGQFKDAVRSDHIAVMMIRRLCLWSETDHESHSRPVSSNKARRWPTISAQC